MRTIQVHAEDETWEVPAARAVCPECEGEGSVLHDAFRGVAYTQSEWAEHDEDFRHQYITGGYDVACPTCKGLRVVLVPAYLELNIDEAHHVAVSEAEAEQAAYWDAMSRREQDMERRMGC